MHAGSARWFSVPGWHSSPGWPGSGRARLPMRSRAGPWPGWCTGSCRPCLSSSCGVQIAMSPCRARASPNCCTPGAPRRCTPAWYLAGANPFANMQNPTGCPSRRPRASHASRRGAAARLFVQPRLLAALDAPAACTRPCLRGADTRARIRLHRRLCGGHRRCSAPRGGGHGNAARHHWPQHGWPCGARVAACLWRQKG